MKITCNWYCIIVVLILLCTTFAVDGRNTKNGNTINARYNTECGELCCEPKKFINGKCRRVIGS